MTQVLCVPKDIEELSFDEKVSRLHEDFSCVSSFNQSIFQALSENSYGLAIIRALQSVEHINQLAPGWRQELLDYASETNFEIDESAPVWQLSPVLCSVYSDYKAVQRAEQQGRLEAFRGVQRAMMEEYEAAQQAWLEKMRVAKQTKMEEDRVAKMDQERLVYEAEIATLRAGMLKVKAHSIVLQRQAQDLATERDAAVTQAQLANAKLAAAEQINKDLGHSLFVDASEAALVASRYKAAEHRHKEELAQAHHMLEEAQETNGVLQSQLVTAGEINQGLGHSLFIDATEAALAASRCEAAEHRHQQEMMQAHRMLVEAQEAATVLQAERLEDAAKIKQLLDSLQEQKAAYEHRQGPPHAALINHSGNPPGRCSGCPNPASSGSGSHEVFQALRRQVAYKTGQLRVQQTTIDNLTKQVQDGQESLRQSTIALHVAEADAHLWEDWFRSSQAAKEHLQEQYNDLHNELLQMQADLMEAESAARTQTLRLNQTHATLVHTQGNLAQALAMLAQGQDHRVLGPGIGAAAA